MHYLDTFLISLVSIILFIVLNKFLDKRKKIKNERYFYFFVADNNYEVSSYVKGEETLLGLIKEFTKEYGYDIDFTICEVTKEEYDSLKED